MKKFAVIFIVVFQVCRVLNGSIQNSMDLYVAGVQNDPKGGGHNSIINKVRFVKGELDKVTEVLQFKPRSSMVFGGPYFKGKNEIVGGRYVISISGHIIDLEDKKVLFGEKEQFHYLGFDHGLAYYRQRESVAGKKADVIFTYNPLAAKKLNQLKKPHSYWLEISKDKLHSPNRKKFIHTKSGKKIYGNRKNFSVHEIWMSNLGKETKVCDDMRVTVSSKFNANPSPVPILWLDNERFLTQRKNGLLVSVNKGGNVSPVVDINITKIPKFPPTLDFNAEGEIIYYCGENYVIDVEKKEFREYQWIPLGHGFYSSVSISESRERVFKWNDKIIGKVRCSHHHTTTAKGFLVTSMYKGSLDPLELAMGWPTGIAVWNTTKKDWVFVDLDWVENIIGFVSNDDKNKVGNVTATESP